MSELFSPLVFQLGIGGIGGFVVGYAIKKLSKLIIVLIGLFMILLLYLGVKVNYDAFLDALGKSLGLVESAFSWLVGLISLLPFMGSFVVGFLLGLKLG